MRLILVRHPKPLVPQGVCYGRLDLDCEEPALDEAVRRLKDIAPGHRVVTSPARRALALAERLGAGFAVEPRLHELDFGDWEGRPWDEIGREEVELWRRGLPHSAPPNGETLAGLAARCADWLEDIPALGGETVAITHAGPIRVIQALLLEQPLLTFFGKDVPYAEPLTLKLPAAFDPSSRPYS